MTTAVQFMLERYRCRSVNDYANALKEILQEISLLGLWRAKFFEHAAFYGGGALRILYGLDRFSEDLDFSLLEPDPKFQLSRYNQGVKNELEAFGFDCEVVSIDKASGTKVQSAFVKANTKLQFLKIGVPASIQALTQQHHKLQVKFEVDVDPPRSFSTEPKILLQPIPFSVNTYTLPSLFAGKLHAVLCRRWQTRVKGRDWYDLVWYVGRGVAVDRDHLKARLVQTGDWEPEKPLALEILRTLLAERVESFDLEKAREDIVRFIPDEAAVGLWSKEFFLEIIGRVR